jgi:hypothetical protein
MLCGFVVFPDIFQLFQKLMPAFCIHHDADCYRSCHSCFVMLSLAKHDKAGVTDPSLSNFLLLFVFPPYALMQKVEPKIKANPNGSACFAAHAQQQSLQHLSFPCFVPSSLFHCSSQLFQKLMLSF